MRAFQIMTGEVVAVRPETTVREIARLLVGRRIGGVPVVNDEGEVIGAVNEGDLFLKRKRVPFARMEAPALFGRFVNPEEIAEEYRGACGLTAADVMRRAVVTVGAWDHVGRVAETMTRHGLRRVPVVSEGKLVGIISRSDIISLLA
jgi:CBS domain-containing protein